MQQSIPMLDLFPGLIEKDFKVHVAQWNGSSRPIDVFTNSFDDWQNRWNGEYQRKDYWNRPFIFSIIELPKQPNRWLFGGIFKVESRRQNVRRKGELFTKYKVSLDPRGAAYIGRLIIHWKKDGRPMGRKPESVWPNMRISEVLPKPYIGEDFPGHASINHSYPALEKLWQEAKPDWRAALEHCHGVYLITDKATGLRYVGSAYGDDGIWSRWATYFKTGGHGGNKLLKKLLKPHSVSYARENFIFSLLEQASSRDSEQKVMEREAFWKQVLLSRGQYGLNDN